MNRPGCVAWGAVLVFAVLWLGCFDQLKHTLRRVGEHWVPALLVAFLFLIISGRLGTGLGLPELFRADPRHAGGHTARERLRRAIRPFLGAFGTAILIVGCWVGAYYADRIAHPKHLNVGSVLCFTDPRWHTPDGRLALVPFVWISAPPVLLMLVLTAAYPARRGVERHTLGEGWLYALAGALAVAAFGLAEFVGYHAFQELGGGANAPDLSFVFKAPPAEDPHAIWSALGAFIVLATVSAVFLLCVRLVSPGLAIAFVVGIGAAVYFFTAFLREHYQLPFLGALALITAATNLWVFRFRLPHLGRTTRPRDYYDIAVRTPLRKPAAPAAPTENTTALPPEPATVGRTVAPPAPEPPGETALGHERERAAGEHPAFAPVGRTAPVEVTIAPRAEAAVESAAAPVGLLDEAEVLGNWQNRFRDKPHMVLLAVSGGAYRAGYWVATVLDKLAEHPRLAGLLARVRLITGASGGMVGAAYHVALRRAALENGGTTRARSVVEQMQADTGGDSLTPVVQQLLGRDLPMLFWPLKGRQRVDRGIVLERQWKQLGIPFRALAKWERAGQLPSLVVTPMLVEVGMPLVITNLRLGAGAELVEFFDRFPEANQFQLATAVRMNATFPFLSPAVRIPTNPPARVVDAGYLDNYGVGIAAGWLDRHREWIVENLSGVTLIQCRAFPVGIPPAPRLGSLSLFDRLSSGFGWLTSPLEGALAARGERMENQNRELLRVVAGRLDEIRTRTRSGFKGLKHITFAFPAAAAMNWFIRAETRSEMERCLGSGDNRAEWEELCRWWEAV